MVPTESSPRAKELDDFIRAFEDAWADGEPADLKAFLPDPDDPLYISVLREVVRIDLEYKWDRGRPCPLDEYRSSYPELFLDREALVAITFEEYRLRLQGGEDPKPDEYTSRYAVDVSSWPRLSLAEATDDPTMSEQPRAYTKEMKPDFRSVPPSRTASTDQGWGGKPVGGVGTVDGIFRGVAEEHRDRDTVFDRSLGSDPFVAEQFDRSATKMPQMGGELFGFRLLAELGRGAFGRVYLAQQGELADRLVVLKVVANRFGESRTLAQLQHNHIVPIYSVNQCGAFQTVCMPFFGTTTLGDILKDLRMRSGLPDSGTYLAERIEARTREWMVTRECPRAGAGVYLTVKPRAPLERLSYIDAILWLAVRLADALTHAHGRGILHRDLKPANILLTDEGQPMLLDFNLSEDTKLHRSESVARIGGTLPYMAPEQLQAMKDGILRGDARSDIYSFGIILHELLTGRHPFSPPREWMPQALSDLCAARHTPPEMRRWNSAISPAAESIVRHCLEPEPSRRYQTAQELYEDLRCQLEHRPLKYSPEPSPWERARKWTRRHPRLSASAAVGILAAVLILAMTGAFIVRDRRLARSRAEQGAQQARLEAVAALHRLSVDLKKIESLLGHDIPELEREQHEEGMAIAEALLKQYRVLKSPPWQQAPLVAVLSPEEGRRLREDMGELLLLMAGASARQAQLDRAVRFNGLAEACYPAASVPRALWRQRAELARSVGDTDEARRILERAEKAPADAPRDRYLLLITDYSQEGRLPHSLSLLQEASRGLKENFSVWLILGNCYADVGSLTEAIECYDMASALWPESHWPYLCRGLACLQQADDRHALTSFDEVIRLRPELSQPYYNRALAKSHLGDLAGARADLTHLLSDPKPSPRAYLLRARVRAREGDREGARRDQEEALRAEPRDERDLTARGLARQPRDPRSALADYENALKLNPRYRAALQNKANVLAEVFGRTEEAIAVLDKAVALYPNYVSARAGRGVLHARLGHREAAHADAQESLRRDSKPFTVYQVAGIYALTSRQAPDDVREACRLVESALNLGFGLELLENDRDLDPIREKPEFRRLLKAARVRRAMGNPRPEHAQAAMGSRQTGTGGVPIGFPR
jgi:eukaryotic-like serine/threonine-protein kinase